MKKDQNHREPSYQLCLNKACQLCSRPSSERHIQVAFRKLSHLFGQIPFKEIGRERERERGGGERQRQRQRETERDRERQSEKRERNPKPQTSSLKP